MELELKIDTATAYYEMIGIKEPQIDFDEDGGKEVSIKEYESVQEILALEVSYWATRRLSHCCGSVCDTIWKMRQLAIIAHDEKFDRQYRCLQGEFAD
jgi:hypothetical protein